MAHLATFTTSKFDPSTEPPNEANPIPGKSVLDWLRSEILGDEYESTEPDYEDWGWYMDVDSGTAKYLVGGCCYNDYEEPPKPGEYEWIIQIHKARSVIDWLVRRNKLGEDDALTALIFDAVNSEQAFRDIRFDIDA